MIRRVIVSFRMSYLRRYHAIAGDDALASAMGVGAEEVAQLRRQAGLRRNAGEFVPGDLPPFELGLPRPERIERLTRLDALLAIVCILASLAVYLLTLGPTVTGEDSGELVGAAYTMGIPHPPGYPTWTMLGKLFTLIPYGTAAWRVNLMSAVFSALAVGLTFLLARKLLQPRWAAAAGALAFAYSQELWEQSVIAEVYALNALLFVVCLLILVWWYERRAAAAMYWLAVAYGLSLGNHNTMALLGPPFAAFVLLTDWTPWRRWRLYASATLLSIGLVAAVHLYLPLRAATHPPVNWGDPETWTKFVDVVTRKQYSFMYTEDTRSVVQFGRQVWTLLGLYVDQFSPWVGVLAMPGLLLLLWKDRVRGGSLLAVFVWLTLGFLLILNTRMERETIWVSTVFYIPSWLLMAVGLSCVLATTVSAIARIVDTRTAQLGVAAALALIVIISPLWWNYHHNDRSSYRYTADYAANIFHTLDPDAIYFPSADHATFPAIYLQSVEGLRPDVTIANKYGYPEESLYNDMPGREDFHTIPNKQEETRIEDWVIQNSGRPVYFSARREMDGLQGYDLKEEGLLFRVIRPGETRPEHDWWSEYSWASLDEKTTAGELTADYVLSDIFYMQGRGLLAKGETDQALLLFDKVAAINPDNKETLNNLGSTLAERRLLDPAVKYLELSLAADPAYTTALINLAKIHIERGEHAKALLRLEALLKIDDKNPEAVRLSADSLIAIQWYDDAIARYQYLARLTPNDAALYKALGDLFLDHKQDQAAARQYYAMSLQFNPNQPVLEEKLTAFAAPKLPEMPQAPAVPTPTDTLPGLPEIPGMVQMPTPMIPGGPQTGL